jgi:hypothetical protein
MLLDGGGVVNDGAAPPVRPGGQTAGADGRGQSGFVSTRG